MLVALVSLAACEKKITPLITVNPSDLNFDAEGGSQKVSLNTNMNWTATVDNSAISITPSSGNAADAASITVTMPASTTISPVIATITFKLVPQEGDVLNEGPTTAQVSVIQQGIQAQIGIAVIEDVVPFTGGNAKAYIIANMPWTATCATEGVVVTPSTGTGDADVVVTVPESEVARSFEVVFGLNDPAASMMEVSFPIQQSAPAMELGGVSYAVKKMGDGRWWMVENLRYVPEGVTPSSDPTVESKIWYPFNVTDQAPMTEDADVAKYGLLYETAIACGLDEITEANSASFEGVRGLCAEGWHIPTNAELDALLRAYWDEEIQKGAPLAVLEEAGFSTLLGGFRQKNTSIATGAYSKAMPGYIISSTFASYKVNEETGAVTSMNKAAMATNNKTYQRMTIANASNLGGSNVRCVRDK